MSRRYSPTVDSPDAKVDLDRTFAPSLLNSSVYIMSVTLQVVTFAVNYRVDCITLIDSIQGRPFMESLLENKALLYSILASAGWIIALSSGLQPEMSAQFELVEMPAQVIHIHLLNHLSADARHCSHHSAGGLHSSLASRAARQLRHIVQASLEFSRWLIEVWAPEHGTGARHATRGARTTSERKRARLASSSVHK